MSWGAEVRQWFKRSSQVSPKGVLSLRRKGFSYKTRIGGMPSVQKRRMSDSASRVSAALDRKWTFLGEAECLGCLVDRAVATG